MITFSLQETNVKFKGATVCAFLSFDCTFMFLWRYTFDALICVLHVAVIQVFM